MGQGIIGRFIKLGGGVVRSARHLERAEKGREGVARYCDSW